MPCLRQQVEGRVVLTMKMSISCVNIREEKCLIFTQISLKKSPQTLLSKQTYKSIGKIVSRISNPYQKKEERNVLTQSKIFEIEHKCDGSIDEIEGHLNWNLKIYKRIK